MLPRRAAPCLAAHSVDGSSDQFTEHAIQSGCERQEEAGTQGLRRVYGCLSYSHSLNRHGTIRVKFVLEIREKCSEGKEGELDRRAGTRRKGMEALRPDEAATQRALADAGLHVKPGWICQVPLLLPLGVRSRLILFEVF